MRYLCNTEPTKCTLFTLGFNLIIESSTCFKHPNVFPQKGLYMQFHGISCMLPHKQSGRWQVQVFLRMNTWMFETCRRHYN